MKKKIAVVIVVVFLLLGWVALDDITTGNEPDYLGEYAVLAVGVWCLLEWELCGRGVVSFWRRRSF